MKITNKLGLPAPIVQAISNDPYNPGHSDITCTGLIAPPRQKALMKLHADKLEIDASSRVWALVGQAVHGILERSCPENCLSEERLYIERCGWKIGGQYDYFDPASGLLQDYKVTSVWSVKDGAKSEWLAQLNILATIMREHGYQINQLQIVAILRDWRKSESYQNSDYPQMQSILIDIPLWSEEKCEEYIFERVRLHQMARDNLPECSAEERWQTADIWAVMKDGGKRAKKVCISENEAGIYCADCGAGHYVEYRRGLSKRCESYCDCAIVCDQWKKIQEGIK